MKKLLISAVSVVALAGAAHAADLATQKAPAFVPPPPPMWSGAYAGLNAGGTWAANNTVNSTTWDVYQPAGTADYLSAAILSGQRTGSNPAGLIAGGQIGYSWQGAFKGYNFVTGVEADFQGITGAGGNGSYWNAAPNAGLSYANTTPYSLLTNVGGSSSLNWFGTVRGRIGYLATPTLQLYGTGGVAYGGVTANMYATQLWQDTSGRGQNFVNYGSTSLSTTLVGWTAGGGVEWMFMPNWSAKAEYLYYDLGNATGNIVNGAYGVNNAAGYNTIESVTNHSRRFNGNIVRAGVNYHFNFASAPVVAKY